MGFRSADWLGHTRPSWVILAVCLRSLSCWNLHLLHRFSLLAYENKFSFTMTQHITPFLLPLMVCNTPVKKNSRVSCFLHFCPSFFFSKYNFQISECHKTEPFILNRFVNMMNTTLFKCVIWSHWPVSAWWIIIQKVPCAQSEGV